MMNRMIILGLILSCTQSLYPQIKAEQKKSDAIVKALSELVESGKAPGMIAAIASSEGIIAIGSSGVRKVGHKESITCNDLVHLGSCTKAMTSVMLATLVAEGKLDWEMKLVDAIPDLKKSIHPDYQNITLWELLTHRAGISSNPINWWSNSSKEIKERRLSILKENLSSPPSLKRGEFNYSNFGYVIAACMAEKVTGQSWEFLMKQRLFDPLGMSSAGFGDPSSQSIDQPWGHSGSGGSWQPSKSYDAEAIGPAGEVHCSIADWAKFLSLFMPGKNAVLDETYINKLVEPTGFYAGGWGIINDRPWAKGKVLTHNGSNGIWYATVVVAPMIGRAYVVVTNSRDFSSTEEMCAETINKLVRIDMNSNQ